MNINANVKRIQSADKNTLTGALKTNMIGLDASNNKLYFKKSDGTMVPYTPDGGDATFSGVKLTELTGAGSSLAITQNGSVYRTTLTNGGDTHWLEPVISIFANVVALPVSPSEGDRYIALTTANGWTANYIYTWATADNTWQETIVDDEGVFVYIDDSDSIYRFDGTQWMMYSSGSLIWETQGNYVYLKEGSSKPTQLQVSNRTGQETASIELVDQVNNGAFAYLEIDTDGERAQLNLNEHLKVASYQEDGESVNEIITQDSLDIAFAYNKKWKFIPGEMSTLVNPLHAETLIKLGDKILSNNWDGNFGFKMEPQGVQWKYNGVVSSVTDKILVHDNTGTFNADSSTIALKNAAEDKVIAFNRLGTAFNITVNYPNSYGHIKFDTSTKTWSFTDHNGSNLPFFGGGVWKFSTEGWFVPTADTQHTVIGATTIGETMIGKLQVIAPTIDNQNFVITGAEDTDYNATYVQTTLEIFTNEAGNRYIKREGWYWIMCTNPADAWNTGDYKMGGGLDTPQGVYTGMGTNTWSPICLQADGEAGEAITAMGKVYVDASIKTRLGVQIGSKTSMYWDADGDYYRQEIIEPTTGAAWVLGNQNTPRIAVPVPGYNKATQMYRSVLIGGYEVGAEDANNDTDVSNLATVFDEHFLNCSTGAVGATARPEFGVAGHAQFCSEVLFGTNTTDPENIRISPDYGGLAFHSEKTLYQPSLISMNGMGVLGIVPSQSLNQLFDTLIGPKLSNYNNSVRTNQTFAMMYKTALDTVPPITGYGAVYPDVDGILKYVNNETTRYAQGYRLSGFEYCGAEKYMSTDLGIKVFQNASSAGTGTGNLYIGSVNTGNMVPYLRAESEGSNRGLNIFTLPNSTTQTGFSDAALYSYSAKKSGDPLTTGYLFALKNGGYSRFRIAHNGNIDSDGIPYFHELAIGARQAGKTVMKFYNYSGGGAYDKAAVMAVNYHGFQLGTGLQGDTTPSKNFIDVGVDTVNVNNTGRVRFGVDGSSISVFMRYGQWHYNSIAIPTTSNNTTGAWLYSYGGQLYTRSKNYGKRLGEEYCFVTTASSTNQYYKIATIALSTDYSVASLEINYNTVYLEGGHTGNGKVVIDFVRTMGSASRCKHYNYSATTGAFHFYIHKTDASHFEVYCKVYRKYSGVRWSFIGTRAGYPNVGIIEGLIAPSAAPTGTVYAIADKEMF